MGHVPFLFRGRFGVFYVRYYLRQELRDRLGISRCQYRFSLRTADRAAARAKCFRKYAAVQKFVESQFPWDQEADDRVALFEAGLRLFASNSDPTSRFYGTLLREGCFSIEGLRTLLAMHSISNERSPDSRWRGDVHTRARLSDAIDRYCSQKSGEARKATIERYRTQLHHFQNILHKCGHDGILASISPALLRSYVDALPRLPKKLTATDERPLKVLLDLPGDRMSTKTRFSHAQQVKAFLTWCKEQRYAMDDDLSSILKPLLRSRKNDNRRKPFTIEELRVLFGKDSIFANWRNQSPSNYWVPILALYTGARQAELCQLHTDDIRLDEKFNIWVMHITSYDADGDPTDKQLKRTASQRVVPLHNRLLDLGFLDFLSQRQQLGAKRLFGELYRNDRNEFSVFSKAFNRWKEKAGIKATDGTMKDFHSFRHTVETELLNLRHPDHLVAPIIGHDLRGTEGVTRYNHGPDLNTLNEVVQSLNYDLDIPKFGQTSNSASCF